MIGQMFSSKSTLSSLCVAWYIDLLSATFPKKIHHVLFDFALRCATILALRQGESCFVVRANNGCASRNQVPRHSSLCARQGSRHLRSRRSIPYRRERQALGVRRGHADAYSRQGKSPHTNFAVLV